jgi:hypothetical protein
MVQRFRRRPPRRLRPAFDRRERLLAWGSTSDGQVVVATNLGLWLPGRSTPPGRSTRLGWHEIHKASWEPPVLRVVAAELVEAADGYDVVADLPEQACTLTDPGQLPPVVRERVTRSVAYTQQEDLPTGGTVRVVARRQPGVNGVRWQVRFAAGTDRQDPAVTRATADLVRAAATGTSTSSEPAPAESPAPRV